MVVDSKKCTRCNEVKASSEFHKRSDTKSGLVSHCKKCKNEIYESNSDEILRKHKNRPQSDKDATKERARAWVLDNIDHVRSSRKEYASANREKHNERRNEYNGLNRDIVNKKQRDYRKNNRSKVNLSISKYRRIKKETDPEYAMTTRLRSRVHSALRGSKKADTTFNLLGCTRRELVVHLESQFTDGMTWENRSEWHIDHIRPCASFDMLDPEQQCECFHYTNLQPLWAEDNLSKGSRIISAGENL